jgi:hypothetical protein
LSNPAFDHYAHISIIKDIKANNRRFIKKTSNIIDEKNFATPILFHWLLSQLSFDKVRNHYLRINSIIEQLVYCIAVLLVIQLYGDISALEIGLAFLLIATNPFNRFIWNAKSRGISPRNFGILLGYLYLMVFTSELFLQHTLMRILLLSVLSLLIILSSQFISQYIIIFSIFILFFGDFHPVFSLFVSFLSFRVFFPEISRRFFQGQWEHKRMWFKHLAKVDLWNRRHSIYRDFIYDFYIRKSLKYFLTNPFVEAILGFPLFFSLLVLAPYELIGNTVVLSAIVAFLITSFKYTRAFGEPQRYLEMALPGLVFLGIKFLSIENLQILVIVNLIIFLFHIVVFVDFYNKPKFSDSRIKTVEDFILNNTIKKKPILLGNAWSSAGFLLPEKRIDIIIPTFTSWKQYGIPINEILPNDLFIINPKVLSSWILRYKPDWFLLEEQYWDQVSFEQTLAEINVTFKKTLIDNQILLYQLDESPTHEVSLY